MFVREAVSLPDDPHQNLKPTLTPIVRGSL